MFDNLTQKFTSVFNKLRGFGKLTEKNIDDALREVRLALLEADVNLEVVRAFLEATKVRALGTEVLQSMTPQQQFLKIVHEELVHALGGSAQKLDLLGSPPHVIMMTGLQGAGKTTTTAKLALWLSKNGKKPYLVPADVQRPAAIEQLKTLGRQLNIPVYQTSSDDKPIKILKKALAEAETQFCDVLLIDTAGRLHVDDELMKELKKMKEELESLLKRSSKGPQILYVVDAMMGQEAVKTAKTFHGLLNINGVIITKMDGDARGGAALSLRHVAQCPVYFAGIGEKIEDLEVFDPERLVSRLLDRGDLMTLVEKAKENFSEAEAKEMAKKLKSNRFDLEDFKTQLKQMKKMGSMQSLLGFIPGGKSLAQKVDFGDMERDLKKKEAIIGSMTPDERRRPEILNGTRRLRIAKGSGTQVAEVNRLLKEFGEMQKMMKNFGKMKGQFSMMKKMMGGM